MALKEPSCLGRYDSAEVLQTRDGGIDSTLDYVIVWLRRVTVCNSLFFDISVLYSQLPARQHPTLSRSSRDLALESASTPPSFSQRPQLFEVRALVSISIYYGAQIPLAGVLASLVQHVTHNFNSTKRSLLLTMMIARCSLLLLSLLGGALALPEEDRVHELPLFGEPPTPQYSGYLNGTDGCDTAANGDFCLIHYWLAMSKKGPDAPVVLWLNGGPGSSSLLGFVQELGPLLVNATGGLMENPWAWTNVAHVFVIESPIGVGYSYCANQLKGQVCKNTDKFTASTARVAIVSFFEKFPELAQNDFFITGESYAGVYIPTMAREIVDHAPHINLVGLAVGDPCTDNTAQFDAMDSLWYGHKYGLVDDAVFDMLWNTCEIRSPTILAKGIFRPEEQDKKDALRADLDKMSDECKLALRKFQLSSSRGLSQGWDDIYIDDYSLFAPVTNEEDIAMTKYLNRSDVRKALHVTDTPIENWPYPNVGFDYTKQYDACNESPEPHAPSMIKFYSYLAPKLKAIWVCKSMHTNAGPAVYVGSPCVSNVHVHSSPLLLFQIMAIRILASPTRELALPSNVSDTPNLMGVPTVHGFITTPLRLLRFSRKRQPCSGLISWLYPPVLNSAAKSSITRTTSPFSLSTDPDIWFHSFVPRRPSTC
jgi:hypothetical protein